MRFKPDGRVRDYDHYPFGMMMPGRKFDNGSGYRYGFNGKENDKDISEGGQDYGMRIYDARVGRFLSVDPITTQYPELTPYQFASNRPTDGIDQDGLEWMPVNDLQGNATDFRWIGFNSDGSRPTGTVASGAIVRNGCLYSFSSTSLPANPSIGYSGCQYGSFSVDDGSNVVMSASLFTNNAYFAFTQVNETGRPLTVFASGELGDPTNASGTAIASALNYKYHLYEIENEPRPAAGNCDSDGLGPFDFLTGTEEMKFAAGVFKFGFAFLIKAEAKHVFKELLTKVELSNLRKRAVKQAWAEERKLVEATGKGTRNWTKSEINELLKKGKVSNYEGHHINSVNGNPRLAGNPDNIEFVKGRKGNLAAHNGDFRNPTSGPLKNRKIN